MRKSIIGFLLMKNIKFIDIELEAKISNAEKERQQEEVMAKERAKELKQL